MLLHKCEQEKENENRERKKNEEKQKQKTLVKSEIKMRKISASLPCIISQPQPSRHMSFIQR